MKQISLEKARENLKKRFPYFELLSYDGCESLCKVLDTEYDEEFEASYHLLIKGKSNCPSRSNSLRRKTCLEKYGVDNPQKSKKVRKKTEETNKKRYGTKSSFQNEEVKSKYKQSMLSKYGVENSFQVEEVKQKIKKRYLEKYGVDHSMKLESVKAKVIEAHIKSGKIKHLINGVPVTQWTKQNNFNVPYSSAINGFVDFGLDFFKFWTPSVSRIEYKIKALLDDLNLNYIHEKKIYGSKNRPDFLLPKEKLIIECNGLYWHSEKYKAKYDHFKRREEFNSMGYRVISFYEDQLNMKFDICKSIILNALNLNKFRVYARKTQIKNLTSQEGKAFFNENHLMGVGKGKFVALVIEDKIVCALQFFIRNGIIEVSRFCSKNFYSVVGGYSKLLTHLTRETGVNKIQTFIDLDYGQGTYLTTLGFSSTKPYPSFYWTDKTKRYHRLGFPGNTGYSAGLIKIWDSGQQLWKNY